MTREGEGLAGALKRARAAAGLSQPEAARKAKIHKVTLSRYENGHRTPDADDLGRLARAYGLSVGELLGEGSRTDTAAGNEKPAASKTGGLPGPGGERSPVWWDGYWWSREETLHQVLSILHGATAQIHDMARHAHETAGQALEMHREIRANTVPARRDDLTPEQLEQAETAYRLLADKEKAEREPAADAEHPTPPAKRPSRRRAGGSGK